MTNIILRRRRLGRGSTNGIQSYSETGIKPVRNWVDRDWPARHTESGVMTIFRWGCTSNIPAQPANVEVVNSASSIHWCSNKKQGRLDMQEAGVPVPKTWGSVHEWGREWLVEGMTFVARPRTHAQGRHLLHTDKLTELDEFEDVYGDIYISEFIDKEHEYRVFVCQNRAVWVAKKTPGNPEDVAWNVAAGGRFDNVRWGEWPLQVVRAALQAAKVSGTDFCGVDVMVDGEGRAYVLEVNSAPSQTSPYRQECVAKAFDYIVRNGKQALDDPTNFNNWKSVIHPAVWSRDNEE